MEPRSLLPPFAMLITLSGFMPYAALAADLAPQPQIVAPIGPMSLLQNFYVHLGPVGIFLDAGAKIYTPAGRLPGATIKIAPDPAFSAEIGYRFGPNWAVSMTGGSPPVATVQGAGSINAVGKLGSVTYGPVSLTGHYHFTNFGPFQPYVGVGPAYMISFSSHDAALTGFQTSSAWGAVAQVGADYMLTDHFGIFIDLKKAYLHTNASGYLFGVVPLTANVKLDPLVLSGGVTYRF